MLFRKIIMSSKAESAAASHLTSIGITPCQEFTPYYPDHFSDKNGKRFRALPDFIYHIPEEPDEPLFIEYKHAHLNSKTTVDSCLQALTRKYEWLCQGKYLFKYPSPDTSSIYAASDQIKKHFKEQAAYIQLECGWNHSRYKHSIITKQLPIGKYVLVFPDSLFFSDKPEDMKEFNAYAKKGINCLALSEVERYIQNL